MNKLLIATALSTAVFGAAVVRADGAGSCHFHGTKPAAEPTVLGCASQRKTMLVNAGKLDATWQGVAHDSVALVDGQKGKEWKVAFKNSAAKDAGKDTLYMFFTPVGNFVAANFTGK